LQNFGLLEEVVTFVQRAGVQRAGRDRTSAASSKSSLFGVGIIEIAFGNGPKTPFSRPQIEMAAVFHSNAQSFPACGFPGTWLCPNLARTRQDALFRARMPNPAKVRTY
jgi:hypothetical protein